MSSAASWRTLRPFVALAFVLSAFLSASSQAVSSSTVQSMKLVAGQSGWLLANNRLFWTGSLGAQWKEITPPSESGAMIGGVSFNAAGHGWAAEILADGSFKLAATTDSGAHWATGAVPSPFTDGLVFSGQASPSFADDEHGWLMLSVQSSSNFSRGILLQTADGGAHWTQLPVPPVGGDIAFTDGQHGFAGPGPRGDDLYATADGGQTWQAVSLPAASSLLAKASSKVSLPTFTDAAHASLLRSFDMASGTAYVRYGTTDGGASWQPAAPVQGAAQTLVSLATSGSLTGKLTPVPTAGLVAAPAAGLGTLTPVQATFSTSLQGWVLLSGGVCSGTSCSQTSTLQGTLDGGKTFFPLGKLPGISLETTHTTAPPRRRRSQ